MSVNTKNSTLNDEFQDSLFKIKALEKKYLLGNANLNLADVPEQWRDVLENLDNEQVNLSALILMQQQQLMLMRPLPNSPLTAQAEFPVLDLPAVPLKVQQWLQSIEKYFSSNYDDIYKMALIYLFESRHMSAHPKLWMEWYQKDFRKKDDLSWMPLTYRPWLTYYERADLTYNMSFDDIDKEAITPNSATYLLKKLRHSHPEYVRELLKPFILENKKLDKKVSLTEILMTNLNGDDVPIIKEFIELYGDDQQSIKSCACRLGLTLDKAASVSEETRDSILSLFELKSSGLLKKTYQFALKNNKKDKYNRMSFSFSLFDMCQVFDISFRQFIDAWNVSALKKYGGYHNINQLFLEKAINEFNDDDFDYLVEKLDSKEMADPQLYRSLIEGLPRRYSSQKVQEIFESWLQKKHIEVDFVTWLSACPFLINSIRFTQLESSFRWEKMTQIIKDTLVKEYYLEANHLLTYELLMLGLYLTRESAQKLFDLLITMGVRATDPALNSLKLNIELAE